MDQAIDDQGGNEDGFLDPGESAALMLTLRNYGEPALEVQGTLVSEDPYLEVTQPIAHFNNIGTGGQSTNLFEPFGLSAAPGAPVGYIATLTLTLNYEGGQSTCLVPILLGRFHYLVWDPSPDQSSGPVIASTLAGLGYTGVYSQDLPDEERLESYRTLWISLGIYASNYVIPENSSEALAIEDYVYGGGHCYLEGSDLWYYDPGIGGHDFGGLFGINPTGDGSSDCGPVLGADGTFTQGMSFNYSGENNYIDHLAPLSGSVEVLRNASPTYGLAIAHEGDTSRTLGASFEFGGLVDGGGVSTKAQLAMAIMAYFLGGGTDAEAPAALAALSAWPNPSNPATTLRFHLADASEVSLSIHDLQGRLLRVLVEGNLNAGEHQVIWDGKDAVGRPLASGVYFARLLRGQELESRKLVLVK